MERLEELMERIKKFTKDRDWEKYHTPENLAKSISIEANELLECFQWSSTEYNTNDVIEELADCINYCLQMADTLNVDVIDIVNKKMDKNELKYPVEFSKGNSKKYNELESYKKIKEEYRNNK